MNRKDRLEVREFPEDLPPEKVVGSFYGPKTYLYWTINLLAYFLPAGLKRKALQKTGLTIGEGTMISQTLGLDFMTPENVSIGENCVIGFSATILGHEMLTDRIRTGPTEIGDNVLIGSNATVLPGVKIGDGATVAAGAVVTDDVEADQKVAGVPAQPIDSTEESRKQSE